MEFLNRSEPSLEPIYMYFPAYPLELGLADNLPSLIACSNAFCDSVVMYLVFVVKFNLVSGPRGLRVLRRCVTGTVVIMRVRSLSSYAC